MSLLQLVRTLRALPSDRRAMLVVRSMPFGDIIEDDTRRLHFSKPDCEKWPEFSYRICRMVK